MRLCIIVISMGQCQGITKSGKRCRIKIADDGVNYCRYHKSQDPKFPKLCNLKDKRVLNESGYIYVFTLEHMLRKKPLKNEWLRMALPTSDNIIDYDKTRELKPKHYILLKIGFTSGTPKKRLQQWKRQCKHQFVLVTPEMLPSIVCSKMDKMHMLLHSFSRLSLKDLNGYTKFDNKSLGFRTKMAYQTEQKIHHNLHQKYGFGKLYCDGCKDANGGIHKEWFLLPREDVKNIFAMINKICQ